MSNNRSIDHVVIAVHDLDEAATRYEALGFTLTPRAYHSSNMGTSNRLIQFAGRNYIELLEVDRPDGIDDHAFAARPPQFSFGTHNRSFLKRRSAMSMMVLPSTDAVRDLGQFAALSLDTYAPFHFERQAQLPDGSQVTVAFTLGFVTSADMPEMAFFVCQHHSPQYFWKPDYQSHENGAQSISAIYISAQDPDRHVEFLTKLTGGTPEETDGGKRISGEGQEVLVLTPRRLRELVPDAGFGGGTETTFAGIAVTSPMQEPKFVRPDSTCEFFVEWRSC